MREHDSTMRSRCALVVCAVVAVAAAGCRRGPSTPSLEMAIPEAFDRGAAEAEPVPDRWWTTFGDPDLDAAVERALRDNYTLAGAWERLQEARAGLGVAAAERWPSLEAEAGAGVARDDDGEQVESWSLGASAGYEIDLWGRISAQVDAERFRARASLADYRAAAITLSAEVALAWYRLATVRGRHAVVERQLATNRQVLDLLRDRFAAGRSRRVDLLRQRQLVAATETVLSELAGAIEVLEHRLAVLQGLSPQGHTAALGDGLPGLPAAPATGLPAELVRRRPDVRAAHERLAAANRDLAAAISDRYPRLAISGSVVTTAEGPDDLFRSWLASLAANLVAPLLDGGRRAAEVDRRAAIERRLLYAYGQAVLDAFAEVEDALAREHHQRRRIAGLERQLALARESAGRLDEEYLNGVSDYLAVLLARREVQAIERELVAARGALVERRIALHRALAGGFGTAREIEANGVRRTSDHGHEEAPSP